MLDIKEIAKKARNAGYDYSILDTKSKNEALYAIADELDNNREAIFSVNKLMLKMPETMVLMKR